MTSVETMSYRFLSQAYADDPEILFVKSLTGSEGISQLYEFDINLLSDDPEIDLKAVLTNPATLTFERDEGDLKFHGIVAHFEQLPEIRSSAQYRAILVPRLWQADLYHQNQLFLDKSVPDIIRDILEQTGLTSQDYELRLTGSYSTWEYICQFDETDFNFISRWMEREGISFFFEQTEEGEKLIITDSSSAHSPRPERTVSYTPPTGETPDEDVIQDFVCIHKRLPQKVVLQDYNYRSPSQMLKAEADVDPQGQGTVTLYGEHFKDTDQGNALARIRAESLLCREKVFHGESIVPDLCPGFLFELDEHFRPSYNQQYLVTNVTHQGSQSGFHSETGGELGPKYSNVFSAIPSEIQYRPKKKTPRPKFFGTLNAKVDAAGADEYAELDDQGRYKVILPFDQSGRSDGKASRFVRMSQPYAGANYGMHFPLHKGVEVLLTFVDGDPDRPIIAGSVPNPETASPVTSTNQTQCVIQTGGGNKIHSEDKKDQELVMIESPKEKSFFRIGTGKKGGDDGTELATKAHQIVSIGQKRTLEVGEDTKHTFKANIEEKTLGDKKGTTIGNTEEKKIGDSKATMVGNQEVLNVSNLKVTAVGQSEQTKVAGEKALYVGTWDITGIAGNTSVWVGTKSQVTIALASEVYVGGKSEVFVGAKSSIAVGGAMEVFVGMKTSINVAGALEVFVGIKIEVKVGGLVELVLAVKLAVSVSASLELAAGPKLVNTPTGIKNEGIELSTSAIKTSMSGLTNFF